MNPDEQITGQELDGGGIFRLPELDTSGNNCVAWEVLPRPWSWCHWLARSFAFYEFFRWSWVYLCCLCLCCHHGALSSHCKINQPQFFVLFWSLKEKLAFSREQKWNFLGGEEKGQASWSEDEEPGDIRKGRLDRESPCQQSRKERFDHSRGPYFYTARCSRHQYAVTLQRKMLNEGRKQSNKLSYRWCFEFFIVKKPTTAFLSAKNEKTVTVKTSRSGAAMVL